MADSKCVAFKYKINDLFDKALKDEILKEMGRTAKSVLDKNKSKGLVLDNNCKEGWMLEVTVTSLTVNDPDNPTSMEAKVSIDGVALQGPAKAFKASSKATAKGLRGKKLAQVAKLVVSDALEDSLSEKAIPQMLGA